MGKPVVATQTPTMQTFKDYVYLATDIESYTQKIRIALKDNSPSKVQDRISFAQTHTWKNSAQLILNNK